MKIKKIAAKLKEVADKIGRQYFSLKEKASAINSEIEDTKTAIKQFASVNGSTTGKLTFVEGDEFVVGFQKREASTIDYEKLFRLRPDIKSKVMVKVPSSEKLEELVVNGEVSRRILTKCVVSKGKPVTAVYVVTLEDFKRTQKDDEDNMD